MKINNHNEETEKTMQVLDALTKVKSSPFFITKLEALFDTKLEAKNYSIQWKTSLKYAFFILIIAIIVYQLHIGSMVCREDRITNVIY